MPQLVDILLFTVLSRSTQSLACGQKAPRGALGSLKNIRRYHPEGSAERDGTFWTFFIYLFIIAVVVVVVRPALTCPRLRNRR